MKVFSIAVMIAFLGSVAQSQDCVEELRSAVKDLPFKEKRQVLEKLEKEKIACLFATTVNDAPPESTYWIPDPNSNRVTRFWSISTQPVNAKSEKHFFTVNKEGASGIFGYTINKKILSKSNGFFMADYQQVQEQVVLDYTLDFETMLNGIAKPDGFKPKKIKNADSSLSDFRNMREAIRKIDDDIAVGLQFKRKDDSEDSFVSYILLLRMTE